LLPCNAKLGTYAFSRFEACERESKKKRGSAQKKARKKLMRRARKKKVRIRAFFVFGGGRLYVRMYVCMYVCTFVCMYVFKDVNMWGCMCSMFSIWGCTVGM
jgi:hypothetical protein